MQARPSWLDSKQERSKDRSNQHQRLAEAYFDIPGAASARSWDLDCERQRTSRRRNFILQVEINEATQDTSSGQAHNIFPAGYQQYPIITDGRNSLDFISPQSEYRGP
jgi:hypothetical protein